MTTTEIKKGRQKRRQLKNAKNVTVCVASAVNLQCCYFFKQNRPMEAIRNRKNVKTKSRHKQIEKLSESNSDIEEIRENGIDLKANMGNVKRYNNHDNKTVLCAKNNMLAKENKIQNITQSISDSLCDDKSEKKKYFRVNFEIDLISVCLLLCGLATRMYRLEEPRNIV